MDTQITPANRLQISASKPSSPAEPDVPAIDEELVVDDRSELRPAQIVEDKLSGMLKGQCVKVSQLRLRSIISGRT
jgi:hypothetical protein